MSNQMTWQEIRDTKTIKLVSPFITARGSVYGINVYKPKELPDVVYQKGQYQVLPDGQGNALEGFAPVTPPQGVKTEHKHTMPSMRTLGKGGYTQGGGSAERATQVDHTPKESPELTRQTLQQPSAEDIAHGIQPIVEKKSIPLQNPAGPQITKTPLQEGEGMPIAERSSQPYEGPQVTESAPVQAAKAEEYSGEGTEKRNKAGVMVSPIQDRNEVGTTPVNTDAVAGVAAVGRKKPDIVNPMTGEVMTMNSTNADVSPAVEQSKEAIASDLTIEEVATPAKTTRKRTTRSKKATSAK